MLLCHFILKYLNTELAIFCNLVIGWYTLCCYILAMDAKFQFSNILNFCMKTLKFSVQVGAYIFIVGWVVWFVCSGLQFVFLAFMLTRVQVATNIMQRLMTM